MILLIAILLVILLPLAIVWWIDVTVEDEFFDNFKPENRAAAVESDYEEAVNSKLVTD